MDQYSTSGGDQVPGLCVGDHETQPVAQTFYNSPFAIGRGIDIIVDPRNMNIVFNSAHGTPGGNENLTGAQILAEVQEAVANLQGGVDICAE